MTLDTALAALDRLAQLAAAAMALVLLLVALVLALELRSRLRRFPGDLYDIAGPGAGSSAEHLFLSLHGLLRGAPRRLVGGQPFVALSLVGRAREVRFQIWIPHGEEAFVLGLLRGAHPGCELTLVPEPADGASAVAEARARLARGDLLPIATRFAAEPLAGLGGALARAGEGEEVRLELLLRPKGDAWRSRALAHAQRLREGRVGNLSRLGLIAGGPAWDVERRHADAIERKAASPGFDCVLRIVAATKDGERSRELVRVVAASLAPYAAENHFTFGSPRDVRGG